MQLKNAFVQEAMSCKQPIADESQQSNNTTWWVSWWPPWHPASRISAWWVVSLRSSSYCPASGNVKNTKIDSDLTGWLLESCSTTENHKKSRVVPKSEEPFWCRNQTNTPEVFRAVASAATQSVKDRNCSIPSELQKKGPKDVAPKDESLT